MVERRLDGGILDGAAGTVIIERTAIVAIVGARLQLALDQAVSGGNGKFLIGGVGRYLRIGRRQVKRKVAGRIDNLRKLDIHRHIRVAARRGGNAHRHLAAQAAGRNRVNRAFAHLILERFEPGIVLQKEIARFRFVVEDDVGGGVGGKDDFIHAAIRAAHPEARELLGAGVDPAGGEERAGLVLHAPFIGKIFFEGAQQIVGHDLLAPHGQGIAVHVNHKAGVVVIELQRTEKLDGHAVPSAVRYRQRRGAIGGGDVMDGLHAGSGERGFVAAGGHAHLSGGVGPDDKLVLAGFGRGRVDKLDERIEIYHFRARDFHLLHLITYAIVIGVFAVVEIGEEGAEDNLGAGIDLEIKKVVIIMGTDEGIGPAGIVSRQNRIGGFFFARKLRDFRAAYVVPIGAHIGGDGVGG